MAIDPKQTGGAVAGRTIGQILFPEAGPVGGAVGGFLGGLAGGLFGGDSDRNLPFGFSSFRDFGAFIVPQSNQISAERNALVQELRDAGFNEDADRLRELTLDPARIVNAATSPEDAVRRNREVAGITAQFRDAFQQFQSPEQSKQREKLQQQQLQLPKFFEALGSQGVSQLGQQPQPVDRSRFPNLPVNELLKIFRPTQFTPEQFQTPTLPGFNFDFFDRLSVNNLLGGGGDNDFALGGFGRQQQPQAPQQQQVGQGIPFSPTGGRLFSAKQKAPTGLAFLS